MKENEYMWILLSYIAQETTDQYDLTSIEDNIWIYIEIQKRMPGLKQAGKMKMTA